MGTKTLTVMRADIRLDLKDSGALWSDGEIDRSVQRAVADLSRFLPRQQYYEETIEFGVSAEAWTSAAAAGTYVQLNHKPMEKGGEAVTNAAGTACKRDTDYTMDYINGKITHISGGEIGNTEDCHITYKKRKVTIDISSISGLIRVDRVEYPYGDVPQSFANYEVYGDYLTVTGSPGESQQTFGEGYHIVVRYLAEHTAPIAAVAGTFPSFLDWTVEHMAGAYCLLIMALQYEHQAVTDFGLARTALGTIANTDAEAALAKVDTYLAGASAPSVKKYLEDGDANIDVVAYLSGASAPSTKKYLEDGDDKIDTVTVGKSVGELYATFAQVSAQLAAGLLSQARAYTEYAGASARIAEGFISEAAQRTSLNQVILAQATSYMESASSNVALAEMFRREAIERRNEVWAIWRDPRQYIGQLVTTPPTDMGRY